MSFIGVSRGPASATCFSSKIVMFPNLTWLRKVSDLVSFWCYFEVSLLTLTDLLYFYAFLSLMPTIQSWHWGIKSVSWHQIMTPKQQCKVKQSSGERIGAFRWFSVQFGVFPCLLCISLLSQQTPLQMAFFCTQMHQRDTKWHTLMTHYREHFGVRVEEWLANHVTKRVI